ncbi:MAG: hypothetical protein LBF78_12405 [Treponema sp.]|nr:hypothetical protein [Treponema sp.]
MNSEQFSLARDLFYLNWAFIGAALGCFLKRFKRNAGVSYINRTLTFAIILVSGAVAAAAGAVIVSGGAIFLDSALYIPALLILVILAAAFRFPLAGGLPLFLLSGVFIVWLAFSLLRYPPASEGRLALISNDGGRRILIDFETLSGENGGSKPARGQSVLTVPAGSVIEITYTEVSSVPYFPIVGGGLWGLVTEIKSNAEDLDGSGTLYTARGPTPGPLSGTVSREFKSSTPSQTLKPGQSVSIYKEGGALISR